jgi:long-subunit acyl-CoA synthetase (AMP-forming)
MSEHGMDGRGALAHASLAERCDMEEAITSDSESRQPRDIALERRQIDEAIGDHTLCSALARTASTHPEVEALKWPTTDEWASLTWAQYRDLVRDVALGLRSIGFSPGGFGVLLTRNRPEQVIASHALLHAGGTPVGLYNALAPAQIAYIANHCVATVAIVDAVFLDKLAAIRADLPNLSRIVVVGSTDENRPDWVVGWEDVVQLGRAEHTTNPYAFEEASLRVTPDDLAALIYTSGTSGPPKGVMITHRNALREVEAVGRMARARAGDRTVSFVPLAHVTEQFFSLWQFAVCGTTTHFCPDPAELLPTLRAVRPTWFFGPPRVWEKVHAGIHAAMAAQDPAERRRWEAAIESGRQLVACDQGGARTGELAQRHAALRPVRSAIVSSFGLDQCRIALTGSAPCSSEVLEFFHALGLRVSEAWGMTETSCAGTWNGLGKIKIGSVGRTIPGLEARIAPDGELVVRAGTVSPGYYRDPERTGQCLDAAGWLHTGDMAEVDEDGYYRIVDRKKELIINAYGKNISPANLESLLKNHPLIGQACVVGDRRPHLVALLVLDGPVAAAWARERGIETASLAKLSSRPEVVDEVQRGVEAVNEQVSAAECIRAFTILPTEWTPETEELTPTLKLKRRVITARYAAEIERMYSGERGSL